MAPLLHEPLVLPMPENIELVAVDPRTGLRAGAGCSGAVELPFIAGSAPAAPAPCAAPLAPTPSVEKKSKSWWQRLFE